MPLIRPDVAGVDEATEGIDHDGLRAATLEDGRASSSRGMAGLFARVLSDPAHDETAAQDVVEGRLFPDRSVVLGRYTLTRLLGSGGCGLVYEATDTVLDRRIAIKLLRRREGRAHAEQGEARLAREAKVLAQLGHPNVVQIYDVGVADDRCFLATEIVDGVDLFEWTRAEPRSRGRLLDVMIQAGRGLAAAHRAGIVHRDVKPSNILVGHDGRVRVVDFGLARAAHELGPTADDTSSEEAAPARDDGVHTRTGALLGTPAYMPPEQHERSDVDARADVYAFSVTLYEAVHGVHPFGRIAKGELVARKRQPQRLRRDDTELDDVILRGLAPDPRDRWQDMDAMVGALERARPRKLPRRWLFAATSIAVLGLVPLLDEPDACADASVALDATWNSERRHQLEQTILATSLPYAERTARAVTEELDERADLWRAAAHDACTTGRSGGSSERAEACLRGHLGQTTALIDEIVAGTGIRLDRLASAAASLPNPEECNTSSAPPVRDPDDEPLWAELDRVDALRKLGELPRAADLARGVVAAADERGATWVRAEAGYRVGHMTIALGDPDSARDELEAANRAAQEVGSDALAALTAADLMVVHHLFLADHRAGDLWRRHAEAALERAGNPSRVESELWFSIATCAREQSDYPAMLAAAERAEAIDRRDLGVDHPTTSASMLRRAEALAELGRRGEALALFEEITETQLRVLGPAHPSVAETYSARGHVASRAGDRVDALRFHREALAIKRAAFGETHPETITPAVNVANTSRELGAFDEADRLLREVLPLATARFGAQHPRVGIIHGLSALASLDLDDLPSARRHAEAQVAIMRAALGDDHVQTAQSLATLADVALEERDYVEARDLFASIVPKLESELGPRHLSTVGASVRLADASTRAGDPTAAITAIEARMPLGDDTPPFLVAELCHALGSARLALGDAAGARAPLECAVAAYEAVDPLLPALPVARLDLVRALQATNVERARARELIERALLELVAHGDLDGARLARASAAKNDRRSRSR